MHYKVAAFYSSNTDEFIFLLSKSLYNLGGVFLECCASRYAFIDEDSSIASMLTWPEALPPQPPPPGKCHAEYSSLFRGAITIVNLLSQGQIRLCIDKIGDASNVFFLSYCLCLISSRAFRNSTTVSISSYEKHVNFIKINEMQSTGNITLLGWPQTTAIFCLSCNFVNSARKVGHIAWCDPRHTDSTVFGKVDWKLVR